MEVFTVTRNCIKNGKLEYSITDAVFTDKESAKAWAKKQVLEQAYLWKVKPQTFHKAKGYYNAVELKHPIVNMAITVILQAKVLN